MSISSCSQRSKSLSRRAAFNNVFVRSRRQTGQTPPQTPTTPTTPPTPPPLPLRPAHDSARQRPTSSLQGKTPTRVHCQRELLWRLPPQVSLHFRARWTHLPSMRMMYVEFLMPILHKFLGKHRLKLLASMEMFQPRSWERWIRPWRILPSLRQTHLRNPARQENRLLSLLQRSLMKNVELAVLTIL